jgi:membrane-associated protease RseP (regulator of RpoE activity)
MKRFIFGLTLLFVAFALPLYAQTKDAPKDKEEKKEETKPVVVPFETLPSGHMTVMVKLNGKGPYKLIFDTGAPTLLLNNRIAKEADLLKNAKKPLFAPFGAMGEVTVATLEVGDVKAEKVPAMVMDHPTVEAISTAFKKEAGQIDGIVGFPFFARYKMTLDYRAKTMTFVPNGYNPPNVTDAMMAALLKNADGAVKILAPAAQWGMICDKGEKDEDPGVTVKEVMPGSAAEKAGLKKGDRVLTIDGRWTDSLPDLYTAAGYVKPGKAAPVVVKRDGKEMELQVKPKSGF